MPKNCWVSWVKIIFMIWFSKNRKLQLVFIFTSLNSSNMNAQMWLLQYLLPFSRAEHQIFSERHRRGLLLVRSIRLHVRPCILINLMRQCIGSLWSSSKNKETANHVTVTRTIFTSTVAIYSELSVTRTSWVGVRSCAALRACRGACDKKGGGITPKTP